MKRIVALTFCTALLLSAACSSGSSANIDAVQSDLADQADLLPADELTSADTVPETQPSEMPLDQEPAGPPTVESVCQQLAMATCEPMPTCCQSVPLRYSDVPGCVAGFKAECLNRSTKEAAALEAGTLKIDSAKLAQCLSLTKQAGAKCRLVSQLDQKTICAGIFVSTAELGKSCDTTLSGVHCASGNGICFAEPTGTSCKAWSPKGTLCANGPCLPGLLCIQHPTNQASTICDEPRPENQACTADVHCKSGLACFDKRCKPGLSQGTECKSSFKCGTGLACDPANEICTPLLGENQPCVSLTQCDSGLSCYGVTIGQVCGPGDSTDGKDDPSLPKLFEPCTDLCQKGLKCQTGPIQGRCIANLCKTLAKPD